MPAIFRSWVLVFFLLLTPLATAATKVVEAKLQAVIVYKMIHFISWPSEPVVINLCTLGASDFSQAMRVISRKDVMKGRHLTVMEHSVESLLDNSNTSASPCHLLYLRDTEAAERRRILDFVQKRPVLTISDKEGFVQEGGIIGFLRQDKKIRFAINRTSSLLSGLKISSQLLNLAIIVE